MSDTLYSHLPFSYSLQLFCFQHNWRGTCFKFVQVPHHSNNMNIVQVPQIRTWTNTPGFSRARPGHIFCMRWKPAFNSLEHHSWWLQAINPLLRKRYEKPSNQWCLSTSFCASCVIAVCDFSQATGIKRSSVKFWEHISTVDEERSTSFDAARHRSTSFDFNIFNRNETKLQSSEWMCLRWGFLHRHTLGNLVGDSLALNTNTYGQRMSLWHYCREFKTDVVSNIPVCGAYGGLYPNLSRINFLGPSFFRNKFPFPRKGTTPRRTWYTKNIQNQFWDHGGPGANISG